MLGNPVFLRVCCNCFSLSTTTTYSPPVSLSKHTGHSKHKIMDQDDNEDESKRIIMKEKEKLALGPQIEILLTEQQDRAAKKQATADSSNDNDDDDKWDTTVAPPRPRPVEQVILGSSLTKSSSSSNVNNGNEAVDSVDEILAAVPTSLQRQTVRSLRPSQPGAIAVTGINGRTEQTPIHHHHDDGDDNDDHHHHDEEESSNNNTSSHHSQSAADDGNHSSSSSLPVATVVQAELVNEQEHADMVNKLNEKERELQALTLKLKQMENLQLQVANLRQKTTDKPKKAVVIAVPDDDDDDDDGNDKKWKNKASYNSNNNRIHKQPKRLGDSKRLSNEERYAMKVLLGDPVSGEFSSGEMDHLAPPNFKRFYSDTQAQVLPQKTVAPPKRSGSYSGRNKTATRLQPIGSNSSLLPAGDEKEETSSSLAAKQQQQQQQQSSSKATTTTTTTTTSAVEAPTMQADSSACCVIL